MSIYTIKCSDLSVNKINNGEILFVTSKIWDGNLAETSHISTIGNIMYSYL